MKSLPEKNLPCCEFQIFTSCIYTRRFEAFLRLLNSMNERLNYFENYLKQIVL